MKMLCSKKKFYVLDLTKSKQAYKFRVKIKMPASTGIFILGNLKSFIFINSYFIKVIFLTSVKLPEINL